MSDRPRQHRAPATTVVQPPEPSHAERVRTLASLRRSGTLSSLSEKHPGFPFGSLMPFALDPAGRPLLLISNMAMHTQNLKANPRASLFLEQPPADGDLLGAARATLVGEVDRVPEQDLAEVRATYLSRHENSRYWVDFEDFHFYRMEVVAVYYVGGFGVMGWVTASDYRHAAVDPLADAAVGILAHMNADHTEAMVTLSRRFAGIEATEAAMTSVDRLGFSLRLKTAEGMKGTRINFPQPVRSPAETRAALVEMVRRTPQ